ncbi:hypothetical protein GPECTOR_6g677 [Gonium pectorale]|uniref:Uncharacterized protein n=1 Tax=Gonium pectorale TaxID=33097 RepID=A0A150GWL2_GONPE|nr:hypothetical protein GPECTOR_6g677 [Gonium pectorale]|eukprot:KXZ53760.1 hypothetical protein GPECTOR_6g677 [Gonium pectorale]
MGGWPWRSVEAVSGGPRYFHSCHFDGCFRLNLLRRGGYTQDYTQLPYRRYFINNTVVQSLDRAAATTDSTAVHFWWYDIACRWIKSFGKWLEQEGDPGVVEKGKHVQDIISPWHRYAHSMACQKAFGHTRKLGVGRGTGEPAEIFNSMMGPHGAITRYMPPINREAHLEFVGRMHCKHLVLGLPARLWRMRVRAQAIKAAMEARITALTAELGSEATQVLDQVECLMQEDTHVTEEPALSPVSWREEYARDRLMLQKLESSEAADVEGDVPLGLLLPGANSVTIRQRPQLLKELAEHEIGQLCTEIEVYMAQGFGAHGHSIRISGVSLESHPEFSRPGAGRTTQSLRIQLNGTVRQLLWKHRKRLPNAEEGDNSFPPLRICWALTPAGLAFRRANHDLVKYLANSGRRPSWCGTHLMAEESKDSGKWVRQDIDRVRADMEAARQEASQQRDDADD